jgi:hypothetical protein
MLNPRIKSVNTNLAYSINKYKNIKRKLLTCNADKHFNRTCLAQKITPKYANINIKTSKYSEAAKGTETQTRTFRIKVNISEPYRYACNRMLNLELRYSFDTNLYINDYTSKNSVGSLKLGYNL